MGPAAGNDQGLNESRLTGRKMLNIFVCVKQTLDTEASIALDEEGGLGASLGQPILNPYDEYAVEEAVSLGEARQASVTVVSVGREEPRQALRQCLAMGAGRGVWLDCAPLADLGPPAVAAMLAAWLGPQEPSIVFCGREAIDDGAAQVPAILAARLGAPLVGAINRFALEGDQVVVGRDWQGGSELRSAPLPCVLTAQKGLNQPRYPSMRKVLQAKKAKLERVDLAGLGLTPEELAPRLKVSAYHLPEPRQAGRVLEGDLADQARELLSILRTERLLDPSVGKPSE